MAAHWSPMTWLRTYRMRSRPPCKYVSIARQRHKDHESNIVAFNEGEVTYYSIMVMINISGCGVSARDVVLLWKASNCCRA